MLSEINNMQPGIFTSQSSETPGTLGRNDFLMLLVAQLQNQDPLDPIKNEQFVAQLAQFSSLEELTSINANLASLQLLESSINNSQAVNLIGKSITVASDSLQLEDGTANRASFTLSDAADSVTVNVHDSAGVLVRSVKLGPQTAGNHEFEFDGKDDQGNVLSDGDYTFEVTAMDEDGQAIQVMKFSDIHVDGITFSNGYVYIVAGKQKYLLSDIVEVRA